MSAIVTQHNAKKPINSVLEFECQWLAGKNDTERVQGVQKAAKRIYMLHLVKHTNFNNQQVHSVWICGTAAEPVQFTSSVFGASHFLP